jgi:hypothetical protein
MRTNLCKELSNSLRYVSPKFLICVDHGRFHASGQQKDALALKDAFRAGLIDVYFCTFNGLTQFVRATGNVVDGSLSQEDYLRNVAGNMHLPRVTIVRNDPTGRRMTAYTILDGMVTTVELSTNRDWPSNRPGLKNAFNVGFMNSFVTGAREAPLETAVKDATLHALENWARYA